MAKDITHREYWDEVESLATECVRLSQENDSDLSDEIHEMVDGHQWVIYTAYNYDVLKRTEADSEIEEHLEGETIDGWHAMLAKAAYFGLAGDVGTRAATMLEEESEEDESDED